MSFVSTYNSASIRGWSSGAVVGGNLQLDYQLGPPPPIVNNIDFGSKLSMSNDGLVVSAYGTSGAILYYTTSAISANIISPRINNDGTVWIGQVSANIGNVTRDTLAVYQANANWTVTTNVYPSVYVSNDGFGRINAIDGSGNTIIGLATPSGGGNYQDFYTFVRSGNTFVETQKTTLSGPYYPSLNPSGAFPVSISGDGNILAFGSTTGGSVLGYVDIYNRTGNTYSYQATVTSNDNINGDAFGASTSLNNDGSLLFVGAPEKNTNTGAAYLFKRTGTSWTQIQKLISPKATANDFFGTSLSISWDSNIAAVGAHLEDTGGNNRGSTFIYFNVNDVLYNSQELSGAANGDGFGFSVAATYNDPYYYTAVGAFGVDSGGNTNVGQVYVYST